MQKDQTYSEKQLLAEAEKIARENFKTPGRKKVRLSNRQKTVLLVCSLVLTACSLLLCAVLLLLL